jgi:hypothetical protein
MSVLVPFEINNLKKKIITFHHKAFFIFNSFGKISNKGVKVKIYIIQC